MDKVKKKILRTKMAMIAIFILLTTVFAIVYLPQIVNIIKEPDKFRDFILSYGYAGLFVFVFFQFMHILIPFIPGEFIQIAGGYIYGTAIGTVFMVLGTIVGEVTVFYLVRFLGYPLVELFVSKEKMAKFDSLIKNKKSEGVMFALFLIPGMPKDVLVYIAGLTPIMPNRFFLVSITARFPGLIGSAYIGSNLQQKDYTSVLIISIVSVILVIIGVFLKDKIFGKMKKHKNKGD